MKILCYLDPFVTGDEPATSRRTHIYVWLPLFALNATKKQFPDCDVKLIAADLFINSADIRKMLQEHKVSHIGLGELGLRRLLRDIPLEMPDLIKEKGDLSLFIEVYGNWLKSKLGGWRPDVILGCEQLPRYLQKIFPEAVCLEQPSSGLYRPAKLADAFPYVIRPTKEFKYELAGALDQTELDEETLSLLAEYRASFKKYMVGDHSLLTRRTIDPGNKFRKIFFWPGLFFYGSLIKNVCSYPNEQVLLRHLLDVLPNDCAIAYTTHPIDVAINQSPVMEIQSQRLINFSAFSDKTGNLSLKVLSVCDAMINMQSKMIDVAIALAKPVFDIDGDKLESSRLPGLTEAEMVQWAGGTGNEAVENWLRLSDKYLNFLLTRKYPASFLQAGGNAWKYYLTVVENIRAERPALELLPVTSTLEEAILDNRLSSCCDRFNHRQFAAPPDQYEKIRGLMLSPEITTVGFDVFDTALVRDVYKPTDIFDIMAPDVDALIEKHAGQKSMFLRFATIRAIAERMAKSAAALPGNEAPFSRKGGKIEETADEKSAQLADHDDELDSDIKMSEARPETEPHELSPDKGPAEAGLDDIYEKFMRITGLDAGLVDQIKEIEIEYERRYLSARKSVLALFKLAKVNGKKTLFISDMYLPAPVLSEFLLANGYDGYDALYVSCDHGLKKSAHGALFAKVMEDLEITPEEFVFIGDNLAADVTEPSKLGINAFHYPAPVVQMQSIPGYRECFNIYAHRRTNMFHLGLIANKLFDNPFIPFNNGTLSNRSTYLIGYGIVGPLVIRFCQWLVDNVARNKHDLVLFFARDGHVLQKVYDRINEMLYGGQLGASSYYYCSRAAVGPLYFKLNFELALLDPGTRVYGKDMTIGDYLQGQFGLDVSSDKLQEVFKEFTLAPGDLVHTNVPAIRELLLKHHGYFAELLQPDIDLCGGYFTQQLGEAKNPACVDLGTMASAARLLAKNAGISLTTYLLHKKDFFIFDDSVCGFSPSKPNSFNYLMTALREDIYEPILCAPHESSVKKYRKGPDGVIGPVLTETPFDSCPENVSYIQMGILDFCEDCLQRYGRSVRYMNYTAKDLYERAFERFSASEADIKFLREQICQENPLLTPDGKVPIPMPPDLTARAKARKVSPPARAKTVERKPVKSPAPAGPQLTTRTELLTAFILGGQKRYNKYKKSPYRFWKDSKNPLARSLSFFCRKK